MIAFDLSEGGAQGHLAGALEDSADPWGLESSRELGAEEG